ncbi:MAG: hypothetical protein FJX76_18580 [Armatimonadetes bacterium]|nr:hypothetical protein [Armatimonadota bacterium]
MTVTVTTQSPATARAQPQATSSPSVSSPVPESAGDAVSLSAAAAEPPASRMADRIKSAVDARLLLMPGQLAAALSLCASAAPETARKKAGPATRDAVAALQRLGAEVASEVLAELPPAVEVEDSHRFAEGFLLPTDNPPALVARAQATLDALAQAAPASLSCRVNVLDGGGFQAFAKGGDNIYVSSDFLDMPEDELAATLAHERVHLLERHLPQTSVLRRVGKGLEARAPEAAKPAVKRVAALAEAALQRSQEFEADAGGAEALVAAGWDRQAMVRLISRFAKDARTPDPLDDHPAPDARIAALTTT